jgi:hypothetical protein
MIFGNPSHAQQYRWLPANSGTPATSNTPSPGIPAVSLGQPVAALPSTSFIATSSPIGVGLDRPVPMKPRLPEFPGIRDSQIVPTSFTLDSSAAPATVFRAKEADEAQRMPSTPTFAEPSILNVPDDSPKPTPRDKLIEEKLPKPKEAPKPTTSSKEFVPIPEGTLLGQDCCDTGTNCDTKGLCCDSAGLCCDDTGVADCFPYRRLWIRTEYLLWQTKHAHIPPLVTSSPATSLGVIGQPGTEVLLGGSLDYEEQSGGRFTLGVWLDPCKCFGLEGSYFFLGQRTTHFTAASSGVPLLARPFFNTATGAEDSELVANPVIPTLPNVMPLAGRIAVESSSRFQGAEANGVINLWQRCGRWDMILGGRFLRLDENIGITEDLTVQGTSPFAGANFMLGDHFATRNEFWGGQIGLRSEWCWRRWSLGLSAKVALGDTHERVDINGSTVITPPGGVGTSFAGGLLTQPTNIGRFSKDRFAVAPEAGLNIAYQITPRVRALVGYDFLYISNVARAADQIDRVVNPTQLPSLAGRGTLVGPARPAVLFKDSDFWAQGVNFGLEFRY